MMGILRKGLKALRQYGLAATLKKAGGLAKTGLPVINAPFCGTVDALYAELLQKYNSNGIHGVAIVTSAFEFEEIYNQRTINLAKFLSDEGYGIIYVAWQWHKNEVLQKNYMYVHKNVIQVPLYDFAVSRLEIFAPLKNKKFFVMLPAKIFQTMLFSVKENGFDVYYDIMDDWERFHEAGQAPWYAKGVEEAFVLNASRLTAVSAPLVQKFSHLRADIDCIGNGFCPELLGAGKVSSSKKGGTINVGYFGHLTDAWFDWPLIFALAENYGNLRINIIGYGESDQTRKKIKTAPRINFIGRVSPRELHKHVKQWHVALIPFKKLKLSEAVDPIKIYEFLFFGLPTVSTGIPHLKSYPYTEVSENAPEPFYGAIAKQYESKIKNEINRSVINGFLSDKTWAARFNELLKTGFISGLYGGHGNE